MLFFSTADGIREFLQDRHFELCRAGRLDLAAHYFKFLRGQKIFLDLRFCEDRELFEYLNACMIPSRPRYQTMRMFDISDVLNAQYRVFKHVPMSH